ncbi:glycosyltransferase [Patescibacteria group bacterium]
MRVLFLNSEYPPLGGGAAHATEEIFNAFAKNDNIHIDCVTAAIDNKYSSQQHSENIAVHRLPIGDKNSSLHYQSSSDLVHYILRAKKFTSDLLEKNKYDLIHAFFTVPAGYVAYKYRSQLPYIISLRGSDVPGYNERFSLHYAGLKPIIKRIWKNAAAVVANSQQLSALGNETAPQLSIPVIPNGIDTDVFYPSKIEPSAEETFRIVCVSRLIARKGIDQLIQAVAELIDSIPNLKLDIVGDGNIREDLEKLALSLGIDKQVNFHGRVPHDQLPEIYRQAHLFALPSKNEGMSNTALEALASGLPLILTDTGGAKELVEGNGILLPVNDQSALLRAILSLANNPEKRLEYRQASRQKAAQFTWQATADEYFKLYSRISETI